MLKHDIHVYSISKQIINGTLTHVHKVAHKTIVDWLIGCIPNVNFTKYMYM